MVISTSARACPLIRIAKRPRESGINTPLSLLAIVVSKYALENVDGVFLFLLRALKFACNSFIRCDFPVPFSPMNTLSLGENRKV